MKKIRKIRILDLCRRRARHTSAIFWLTDDWLVLSRCTARYTSWVVETILRTATWRTRATHRASTASILDPTAGRGVPTWRSHVTVLASLYWTAWSTLSVDPIVRHITLPLNGSRSLATKVTPLAFSVASLAGEGGGRTAPGDTIEGDDTRMKVYFLRLKKVITFLEVKRVTTSVTAPGDTNLSDATGLFSYRELALLILCICSKCYSIWSPKWYQVNLHGKRTWLATWQHSDPLIHAHA